MIEKNCTLLLLRRGDQILLAMKKRGFGSGFYNGVGGKIEPGETIEQAMVRECQEEIGVTPLRYWRVAVHDFLQTVGNEPWHIHINAYLCDNWEGEPIETEEMAPRWFDITDIPYGEMWEDDAFWLPQVLAGQKVVSDFTFDKDDKLATHDVRVVEKLPHEGIPA